MYKNKCTKCGAEFETKNPKRVICPACLYPDRKDLSLQTYSKALKENPAEPEQKPDKGDGGFRQKSSGFFVARESQQNQGYRKPDQQNRGNYNRQGGAPRQGGFNRLDGPPRQGGFNRNNNYNRQGGPPRQGGFNRNNNYNRQGGPPRQGGFNRNDSRRRPAASNKKLLISREQVSEIENLYKTMLPLPNPDCHEVIGEKIGLEPNKVFFGINLVRQKMKLPKLPYPKRKLAVSADQLMAIKNLYEPLLPLPPIGCHKIIAKQLKVDEWRVHVGIGIIRKQMDLPRWNTEREDAPEEFKNQQTEEVKAAEEEAKPKKTASRTKKTKETKETKKSKEKGSKEDSENEED